MPDALLFRPGQGSGAPLFKVVASEWVEWYRSKERGADGRWFLLADEDEIRSLEIEAVREADETRWNRLFKRRP